MEATKYSFLRNVGLFLGIVLLFGQSLHAAVTFSVSPPAISNTYAGYLTLQIGGIASGSTVVVQKYVNANSNGVVDAGDFIVQQFNLTDGKTGMVIGGITTSTCLATRTAQPTAPSPRS
jgi:hypothetical protein